MGEQSAVELLGDENAQHAFLLPSSTPIFDPLTDEHRCEMRVGQAARTSGFFYPSTNFVDRKFSTVFFNFNGSSSVNMAMCIQIKEYSTFVKHSTVLGRVRRFSSDQPPRQSCVELRTKFRDLNNKQTTMADGFPPSELSR